MRVLSVLSLLAACHATQTKTEGPDAGVLDQGGMCNAIVTHETPLAAAGHVPQGSDLTFTSNPPSSGLHYPTLADWALEYPIAIPRGNYLHNEEHGGIVMLYNCPNGCQDVADGMTAVGQALPDDPACAGETNANGPINARWLVSPDPLLPDGVQVAAAAWGWTYKADCLDPTTLNGFIANRYAQGGSDRTNCKPPPTPIGQ
jgi:hypothetical protein